MIERRKQWLRTVKGIQKYKIFQANFLGTISKAMSKILLRNATKVRSREKFKKYQVTFIASTPIKTEVMQQIGIDICRVPEVDGLKHLLVSIDHLSKWSKAKPIKDKSVSTIAQYLYQVICYHGCMKIQINNLGREFVNEVFTQHGWY